MSLVIYTAGKMPKDTQRGSVNEWRKTLETDIMLRELDALFNHPCFQGCDHTGIHPEETVAQDLKMIDDSDVLIAYFSENEQYGTIAEVFYAILTRKPVAVFVNDVLTFSKTRTLGGALEPNVYEIIYKTNHRCDCMLETNEDATNYWFPLYLLKSLDVPVVFGDGPDLLEKMGDTIKLWISQLKISSTSGINESK